MIAGILASMLTLFFIQMCYGSLGSHSERRSLDGSRRGLLYDPVDLDRSSGGGQFIELRPGGHRMRNEEVFVTRYPRSSTWS